MKNPNWEMLTADVVERIEALRAITEKLDAPEEWREKIYRDLVLPNLRLLAEFCEAVDLKKDGNDE